MPNFDKLKHQIEMTITAEGLRIEMMETETGTSFDVGSPRPNGTGKELFVLLAQELGKIPNRISLEGHTDSRPFTKRGDYGNWELSVDRANAARRFMQENGVRPDQISQVRGFADQMLRKSSDPQDPSNRRSITSTKISKNRKILAREKQKPRIPLPKSVDDLSAKGNSAPSAFVFNHLRLSAR